MAVTRKPSAQLPRSVPDVETFIQGGGSEPTESTPASSGQRDEVQVVTLRMPKDLIVEVDAQRKRRRPVPSRQQWLLEAIYEKLASKSD